jgi:hypothetical protein
LPYLLHRECTRDPPVGKLQQVLPRHPPQPCRTALRACEDPSPVGRKIG